MALINNIYVQCEEESVNNDVELTSHPTESGLPTSDTVRKKPIELSISGRIVAYDNLTTKDIIDKLNELKNNGSFIDFVGANVLNKLQISTFNYNKTYKVNGGATFNMTLVEHRIAKTAYVAPVNVNKILAANFKVNDTVLFKGGPVYVASDSTSAATYRGKSACKLTKISTLTGAKHKYHLISQDCKYGSSNYVYGWVDESNVSVLVGGLNTGSTTNAGFQTVNKLSTDTYHTVKKGDTVWNLVNNTYKSLNLTVSKVIHSNPNSFSKVGDATTLKVGSILTLR